MKKLKTRAGTLKRKAAAEHLKQQQQKIPVKNIPSSQVPQDIPDGSGRLLPNPYYTPGQESNYAGHPAHFSWFGKARSEYLAINKALKNSGLPEFDTLYAAVIPAQLKGGRKSLEYLLIAPNGSAFYIRNPTIGHKRRLMVGGMGVKAGDILNGRYIGATPTGQKAIERAFKRIDGTP